MRFGWRSVPGLIAILYGLAFPSAGSWRNPRATRACRKSRPPFRPGARRLSQSSVHHHRRGRHHSLHPPRDWHSGLGHRRRIRRRRHPLGPSPGYIGMFISVRANVRTAQPRTTASTPPSKWRSAAAPSPACWWSGLGLLGVRRLLLPRHAAKVLGDSKRRCALPGGPGVRRLLDLHIRAAGRRDFHQGRRRPAPISSARSRPAFPRTTPAIPR